MSGSNFLRTEEGELVLMDDFGPGCVYRIFMPVVSGPQKVYMCVYKHRYKCVGGCMCAFCVCVCAWCVRMSIKCTRLSFRDLRRYTCVCLYIIWLQMMIMSRLTLYFFFNSPALLGAWGCVLMGNSESMKVWAYLQVNSEFFKFFLFIEDSEKSISLLMKKSERIYWPKTQRKRKREKEREIC